MSDFKAEIHQNRFPQGLRPRPRWGSLQRSPRPLAALRALLLWRGGSVAEWLACWIQAQKGPGSNRSRAPSGNSGRQTVHTHCASVHQAAKLVAALLRVAGVTAGLAESNGSLPPGL